jgi:hypothetical protein
VLQDNSQRTLQLLHILRLPTSRTGSGSLYNRSRGDGANCNIREGKTGEGDRQARHLPMRGVLQRHLHPFHAHEVAPKVAPEAVEVAEQVGDRPLEMQLDFQEHDQPGEFEAFLKPWKVVQSSML